MDVWTATLPEIDEALMGAGLAPETCFKTTFGTLWYWDTAQNCGVQWRPTTDIQQARTLMLDVLTERGWQITLEKNTQSGVVTAKHEQLIETCAEPICGIWCAQYEALTLCRVAYFCVKAAHDAVMPHTSA